MTTSGIEATLLRIDNVIRDNRKTEWLFILLTTILFSCGVACILVALITREYVWSSPSMVTTGLLYWPLKEIKNIRERNLSLAIAPILITSLPTVEAAVEIKKLLDSMYKGQKNGN